MAIEAPVEVQTDTLLEVRNLNVDYLASNGTVHAVTDGVILDEDLRDSALGIDQKGSPFNSHRLAAIHVFLFQHAKGCTELFVLICQ